MSGGVKVEAYWAAACACCSGAVGLLQRKGVGFAEYRVDLDPRLRAEMAPLLGPV